MHAVRSSDVCSRLHLPPPLTHRPLPTPCPCLWSASMLLMVLSVALLWLSVLLLLLVLPAALLLFLFMLLPLLLHWQLSTPCVGLRSTCSPAPQITGCRVHQHSQRCFSSMPSISPKALKQHKVKICSRLTCHQARISAHDCVALFTCMQISA